MGGRRSRPLGRRPPRILPRARLLILCEGEITEPRYLQAVRREHRNPLVQIEVVPKCGVPKTLVQRAVERKKEALKEAKRYGDALLRHDEIWCVFDVDSHPKVDEAKKQARDNGLEIVISNPCFELWLLLHFQDQRAHQERGYIQNLCMHYLPGFVKDIPYEKIRHLYEDAVRRAKDLEKWQAEQGRAGENPSTRVYKLTERIVELGKENMLKQVR